LAGHVAIYDHRNIYDRPKILSYYQAGDIIGDKVRDNNISEFN